MCLNSTFFKDFGKFSEVDVVDFHIFIQPSGCFSIIVHDEAPAKLRFSWAYQSSVLPRFI